MPVPTVRMLASKITSSGAKPIFFGQQAEGPLGDGHLAVGRDGLPLFIEGHHDGGRSVTADEPRLPQELGLAFLQADRVDDALPCTHLRPASITDHFELSIISGDAGDFGLGRDQVQEGRHRLFAVEQRLVHIDVEDVGPVGDLVAGDLESRFVVAAADEAGEFFRAGDVRPLADDDEISLGAEGERLQSAQHANSRESSDRGRGATSSIASAIARMCLGVVPQQPPTMLSQPFSANSHSNRRMCSGVSS